MMFFIHTDIKAIEEWQRSVVDLCPIHRKLHEFDLIELRQRRRIYLVPVRRPKVSYMIRAPKQDCGYVAAVDPRDYDSATPQECHRAALEVYQRAETDPHSLGTQTRHSMMTQVIENVSVVVASGVDPAIMNKAQFMPVVSGIGVSLLILVGAAAWGSAVLLVVAGLLAVVVIVGVAYKGTRITNEHAQAALETGILDGLAPLLASQEEIAAGIQGARNRGHKVTKKQESVYLAVALSEMPAQMA